MEENKNQNPPKFDPKAIVEELKIVGISIHQKTEILNSRILGIDEKLKKTETLINQNLKEFEDSISNIKINIWEEDLKKLDTYKDYFKHYKPILYISLFVMISGWGLGIFGAYSGMKYYKESVRTKQEIRDELLHEISREGNIIVEKAAWDNYVEQAKVIEAWQKTYPKDGESLDTYYKGYQEFKKGNK